MEHLVTFICLIMSQMSTPVLLVAVTELTSVLKVLMIPAIPSQKV